MSLILRNSKGAALTWTEADNNLLYLQSLINAINLNYINGNTTINGKTSITSGASITGSVSITGSTTFIGPIIGDTTISGSIYISGSIIPAVSGSATSSFNLGSPTNAWKEIYVSNGSVNFIDANGNTQGTLSSNPDGLSVVGSIYQIPQQPYNLTSTTYFVAEVQGKPSKALSIYNGSTSVNPELIAVQNVYSTLPFDKKYNAYFVQNNGVTGIHDSMINSLVFSLPPWQNIRLAPGETITVYNMSSGSGLLDSGNIYVVSLLQQVLGISSANGYNGYTNRISSTRNNGALLTGTFLNYTNVNPLINSNTVHNVKIQPGQKGTFELLFWPSHVDVGNGGNIFYSNFPSNGSLDGTFASYDNDYLMGYRLVSIDNF